MKAMYKAVIATLMAVTIIAISGVVLNSCQKEKNESLTNDNKTKIIKNGQVENPFEQYGIWHNDCLEYIFSQEDIAMLTANEAWVKYGTEYFEEVLGADYVDISLVESNQIYNQTIQIISSKDYLSILENMVENEKINPDFESPSITENNYSLLYTWFSYLETIIISNQSDFVSYYQKICNLEQEILANYYSLLENEELENDIDLQEEYKGALVCMAVAKKTTDYWGNSGLGLMTMDEFYEAKRLAEIDWITQVQSWAGGSSYPKSLQIGTNASEREKFKHMFP